MVWKLTAEFSFKKIYVCQFPHIFGNFRTSIDIKSQFFTKPVPHFTKVIQQLCLIFLSFVISISYKGRWRNMSKINYISFILVIILKVKKIEIKYNINLPTWNHCQIWFSICSLFHASVMFVSGLIIRDNNSSLLRILAEIRKWKKIVLVLTSIWQLCNHL